MQPMPQKMKISLRVISRSPRQKAFTSSSDPHTTSMRHHTSGSAASEINLPRIAVNPHKSTQKWICRSARRRAASMVRVDPMV